MGNNRVELINQIVKLEDKRNEYLGQAELISKQQDKLLDGLSDRDLMDVWNKVIPQLAHNKLEINMSEVK